MDWTAIFLLSGHQIVRLAAVIAVMYFAVQMYRHRVDGARRIIFGLVGVMLGDGLRAIGFLGGATGWLWSAGALVAALGFALAAYGFSELARAAIAKARAKT